MDLTSLSSTLPHNPSQSHHNSVPRSTEDDSPSATLMSAFRQAALSVTTLYKSANTEIERSRKLGYQDCLEDILQLLESDHVQPNSEVRKIREWVLSKQRSKFGGSRRRSDSAEDSEDEKPRMPTQSTVSPLHSQSQPAPQQENCRATSLSSPAVIPVTAPLSPLQQPISTQKENIATFSFRSSNRLPQHPPPPPTIPTIGDTELVDADSNAPIMFNPPQSRTASGAWKRRFPYNDFLELAAAAEKERDWINKRGRLG